MKAEIIAVGTEILMGQIINTNTTDIARSLQSLNIPIYYQSVVGDNEGRIIQLLKQASLRSQLIVLCGGIGPTEDDLTKQSLAKFLNVPLVYDDSSLKQIEVFFEHNDYIMTENNKRQALVLQGSIMFKNKVGLAAGCAIEKNNVLYIVLPGPPKELKGMLKNSVEPLLQHRAKQVIHSKMLRFVNIGESQLATKIHDIIAKQTNPTIAIYANIGLVDVRISASGNSKEEAIQLIAPIQNEILTRLGEYLYGYDNDTLSGAVVKLLAKNKQTISVAESITGGLFESFLVNEKGASNVLYGGYITYTDTAKIKQLGVPKDIIDQYGVYSTQCAMSMAKQVKQKTGTSIGISFTGLADNCKEHDGPNIYVGISLPNKDYTLSWTIKRDRNTTRELVVYRACHELIKNLEDINGN